MVGVPSIYGVPSMHGLGDHLLLCAHGLLRSEPDDNEIDVPGLGEQHLGHEAGAAETFPCNHGWVHGCMGLTGFSCPARPS